MWKRTLDGNSLRKSKSFTYLLDQEGQVGWQITPCIWRISHNTGQGAQSSWGFVHYGFDSSWWKGLHRKPGSWTVKLHATKLIWEMGSGQQGGVSRCHTCRQGGRWCVRTRGITSLTWTSAPGKPTQAQLLPFISSRGHFDEVAPARCREPEMKNAVYRLHLRVCSSSSGPTHLTSGTLQRQPSRLPNCQATNSGTGVFSRDQDPVCTSQVFISCLNENTGLAVDGPQGTYTLMLHCVTA